MRKKVGGIVSMTWRILSLLVYFLLYYIVGGRFCSVYIQGDVLFGFIVKVQFNRKRNKRWKASFKKWKATLSQLSIPHAKQDVSNKKMV